MTAWASIVFAFTLLAWIRSGRQRSTAVGAAMPVFLIRPADTLSPEEQENLSRPIDYEPLTVHVASGGDGANRKLAHIKEALGAVPAGHRVVIADSDVRVTGALLRSLVSDGTNHDADIVFAAPCPEPGGSRAGRSALLHTLHNFRVLHGLSPTAICGKAMALSPRACAELSTLDDCLAEDLRLAERVFALGGRIRLAAESAVTLPTAGLARFVRWQQALRAHRPLAFVAVPLLIAPLPLLLFARPEAFVAVLSLRALFARRLHPHGWPWFWLGELLVFTAFVAAALKRNVVWRDRHLRLGARGRIVEAR